MRDKTRAATPVTSRTFDNVMPFARHEEHCRTFLAANCAVGVQCPHGYDVCPLCDPCTCEVPRQRELLRYFRKGHLEDCFWRDNRYQLRSVDPVLLARALAVLRSSSSRDLVFKGTTLVLQEAGVCLKLHRDSDPSTTAAAPRSTRAR